MGRLRSRCWRERRERPRGRAAAPPSRRAAEPPSRRAAEPPSRRAAEKRDELAPPAWQEIIWRAAQRSLAVMCPAFVIDTIKAGTTVASAMLTRDRLQAALPRLRQQDKEAQEKEYTERWRKDFKRVEAKRDAPATEYAETLSASGGAARRSSSSCRGLRSRSFASQPYITIRCSRPPVRSRAESTRDRAAATARYYVAKELRLPKFRRGANEPLLAWPPPQPSPAAGFIVPGGSGPDWHAAMEQRERRPPRESQRLSAYYEERERELAKRQAG